MYKLVPICPSVVMLPSPGGEITLFVVKYSGGRFLNNASKHEEAQYNIHFSLSHGFHAVGVDLLDNL
jgi:hypothetical protein